MSGLDIGIIVIVLLAGATGIYWGALRQILALAGLVAGLATAGRYGGLVADALASYSNDPALVAAGGAAIVVVAVSSGASLLASLLHWYVGLRVAGRVDGVLGALLGGIHAVLCISALALLAQAHPAAMWAMIVQESLLPPLLAQTFGGMLMPLLALS